MKLKLIAFAVALCCAMMAIPAIAASAWVGDSYMTPDEGFTAFLNEVKQETEYDYTDVTYERDELFNTDGEVSGYVYGFNFDGETDGFLCLVKLTDADGNSVYEMTELYFETKSPYEGFSGTKLYPTFNTYLVENNGVYTDVNAGIEVPAKVVQGLEEQGFGFKGGSNIVDATITINFDHKNDVQNAIASNIPTFEVTSSSGGNGCASLAGSCIVAYYDRIKTELIPNYDPGMAYGSYYIWKGDNAITSVLIDQLYVDMNTNQTGAGVTVDQYKQGIITYAYNHGNYHVTYRNVMNSNYNYNLLAMENELSNNHPIALFLNPYYNFTSILGIEEVAGGEKWYTTAYAGSHVMTAYGTKYVDYYNANNFLIRSDKYLLVAGAKNGNAKGYIRMTDTNFSLYDAFSVEIY